MFPLVTLNCGTYLGVCVSYNAKKKTAKQNRRLFTVNTTKKYAQGRFWWRGDHIYIYMYKRKCVYIYMYVCTYIHSYWILDTVGILPILQIIYIYILYLYNIWQHPITDAGFNAQAPKVDRLMRPWKSNALLLGNLNLRLIQNMSVKHCQTTYTQY